MSENRMKVETAADLMGVSKQFIRIGLQQGILPFGCAVKVGKNQYTYYISPSKFSEFTGIELTNVIKEAIKCH